MNKFAAFALGLALLGGGIVGCDKKESEEVHKVKNSDGSEVKHESEVKRSHDGTVTETEKKVVTPADQDKH